ncbi:MAG: peptide MFS transporter [Bacteroidia bacterium]|nr:peptide MFS transporter [Bacteroidia bacterium]NNC86399.1 peptide MFS transporter [Bacteroidia bacterium]NNM15557.1 peptide MFS transporter [Bacteroidia bacterium]
MDLVKDIGFWVMILGTVFIAVWIPIVILSQKKVHPSALFTLFFAELWERFSFYGMRALLVLYMTDKLFTQMLEGTADARAYGIYAAYGALVYAMPVLGGLIADKFVGFRKAIIFGGVLMALGHFTLGLEGAIFEGNMPVFFLSLGLIIVGNGYFKPNISSFLGTFYEKDDIRKDGAFSIFYMGVNIGAFLAPLWCGYLAEHENFGYHYGFGLAGIGMVVGIIVFLMNIKIFGDKGLPPNPKVNTTKYLALSILLVPLAVILMTYNNSVGYILYAVIVLVLGYILYYSFELIKQGNKVEGQRLWVVVILFFFHALFWGLFEQAGSSLMLFADRYIERYGVAAQQFAALNAFYIILLAPVFSWMWIKLRKAKKEPNTPMKFVLGLVQLALGYAILVMGAKIFGVNGNLVPLVFLFLMYLFHTTGELSLSPVGLSMVTKLADEKIVGFVMGAWFLSISFAHEIAGILAKLTATPEGQVSNMTTFTDMYWTWGVLVVLGASVILIFLVPTLRKWMHGIH